MSEPLLSVPVEPDSAVRPRERRVLSGIFVPWTDRSVYGYVAVIPMTAMPSPLPRRSAREQILDTAYELFTQRGIRAVGVDEVIARSSVAKATLYKHFRSKNDLALAFLERREQRWTLFEIGRASCRERVYHPV